MLSSVFPSNTLQQFGSQTIPHLISIDRRHIKGILPRPYYRQPIPFERADGSPTRRWGVATSEGGDAWPTAEGTVHNDFTDVFSFSPVPYGPATPPPAAAPSNWDFTLREDGLLYEFVQKVSYTGTGAAIGDWVISQVGYDGAQDAEGTYQGLCPNPFFTVGFRRQALPPEFIAALATDPASEYASTQIVWGMNPEVYPDGRWMLYIPLTGKPVLYERLLTGHPWSSETEAYWWPRQWTEGDLSEIKPERAAKDGYEYHIGCMGHAICVSEGGFDGEGSFAYYLAENASEPIVPYGSMLVRNWPGQFATWLDFNVFPHAEAGRWPFTVEAFRLADFGAVTLGQPFSSVLQAPTTFIPDTVEQLPGVEGMGVLVLPEWMNEDMGVETLARYRLVIDVGTYPVGGDPRSEIVSQTPPFVEAVQAYQHAALTDNGAPAFTAATQGTIDLRASEELEDTTARRWDITVVNARESFTQPDLADPDGPPPPNGGWSPTYLWTPGRMIEMTQVGWRMRDTVTAALTDSVVNYGVYFIIGGDRKSRQAQFTITDLFGMVALNLWEGETDLNFRGWNRSDAIAFGLELQGIGPEQYDLEDTGLTVPEDDDQNYKIGTSWLKIFQGLMDRGGTIWYEPLSSKIQTGCRYCGAKRTSSDVLAHADNGWLSSECLAVDIVRAGATGVDFTAVFEPTGAGGAYPNFPADDLEVEEATLSAQDFANSITVVGSRPSVARPTKHKGGVAWESPQIRARWRNPASLSWEHIVANPTKEDQYLGYPVGYVEKDDSLVTQQEVWRRVAELAARKASRATKIKFTCPMNVALGAGMVVEAQGGDEGTVDGKLFRIVKVELLPGRSRSIIHGREMVGLPAL